MKPSEILRKLADILDAKEQSITIVEPDVAAAEQLPSVELEKNPVMIPPLQQDIELKKAALGKNSDVIDELVNDDDADFAPEDTNQDDELSVIRKNAGLTTNVLDIISGPLDA